MNVEGKQGGNCIRINDAKGGGSSALRPSLAGVDTYILYSKSGADTGVCKWGAVSLVFCRFLSVTILRVVVQGKGEERRPS